VIVLLGVVFGQAVTAAHACPGIVSSSQTTAMNGPRAAMPESCPDLQKKMRAGANVCESLCLSDGQLSSKTDTPTAPISLQPVLVLQLVDALAVRSRDFSSIRQLGGAPPSLLPFSRLLM
jgi:hypothetical protein